MSTVTHRVKKLFVTNPMRMEVRRFRSRFFNCTDSPVFNRVLAILAIVCYLGIVGMVFAFRQYVAAGVTISIQAVGLLLISPLIAHGLIAGERDRRSWDLLQVAPITKDEIVVGKFMGTVAGLLAVSIGFLPLIAIGLAYGPAANLYELALAEGIAITAGAASSAYSLYLSARLKSANAALAVSIASLVGVLIVVPLGFSVLRPSTEFADVFLFWHPLYALMRVITSSAHDPVFIQAMTPYYGWPQIAFYCALTVMFVIMSVRLLNRRAGKV